MRALALWFPDWPVQAAYSDGIAQGHRAVMIVDQRRVMVCNARARKAGIRRGMLVKHALALDENVTMVPYSPERDTRVFERIVRDIDQVAANVEIARPGIVLIDVQGAAAFHGSEEKTAEKIMDVTSKSGMESFVGIADDIPTAIIAARRNAVVPLDGSARYLDSQPTELLRVEETLECDPDTVAHLQTCGLTTLGDIARISLRDIATRFGPRGHHCWTIATAQTQRTMSTPTSEIDHSVSITPEDPITRIDEASFLARSLAAQLHTQLHNAGLTCHRIKIIAVIGNQAHERTWRTRGDLSDHAISDRVRWQLEAWLTSFPEGIDDSVGIVQLTLRPYECMRPSQPQLWGTNKSDEESEQRMIARVQALVGPEFFVAPFQKGGRGSTDCVGWAPVGERRYADERVWNAALPAPLPVIVDTEDIKLTDARGNAVTITATMQLSREPERFHYGRDVYTVVNWAGPWPVDDAWWQYEYSGMRARLQIVAEKDTAAQAWVVAWEEEHGRWLAEGRYE